MAHYTLHIGQCVRGGSMIQIRGYIDCNGELHDGYSDRKTQSFDAEGVVAMLDLLQDDPSYELKTFTIADAEDNAAIVISENHLSVKHAIVWFAELFAK